MQTELKLKVYTKFPNEIIDEAQMPLFCKPVYAKYLKEVKSQEVYWFVGFLNEKPICIIPFSIVKKAIFKKGKFLTAVVLLSELSITVEKEFLELVVEYIRGNKMCDWIEQPANWALFRTVPSNSIFCEFGTYRIDLEKYSENELYNKLDRSSKYEIRKAIKNGIIIKIGFEKLEDCIKIFNEVQGKDNFNYPKKNDIEKLFYYFPANVKLFTAYHDNIACACNIIFYDKLYAYGLYSGTTQKRSTGANYLLFWELIRNMKVSGHKHFDFVGARINPTAGSKQEKIQLFKKHFGGELFKGFLWKMPISIYKYFLYNLLIKFLSFIKSKKFIGDVIDQELRQNQR